MSNYYFRAAEGVGADAPLIFLFHGTGGSEDQFFDLAGQLLPTAKRIAPRGDVSEHGALRYFKRAAEGVYDMADLALRTEAMAAFIKEQIGETRPSKVYGLGYSNGANILASVQFAYPALFDGTMLMHPLIPFTPPKADFSARSVLITAGRQDPIAPAGATEALAQYFQTHGANTKLVFHNGGHEVRQEELQALAEFVSN